MVVNEWEDTLVLITGSRSEREEALHMQEKVAIRVFGVSRACTA